MGTNSIPTIDIGPFTSPSKFGQSDRVSVVDQIRKACLDKGFFLVTGHGVPTDSQRDALSWTRRFFELPMEEKNQIAEDKSFGRSHRGYQAIGGEAYEDHKLPDLKEGFQIGVHKDTNHPDCTDQRMLTGPNIWPQSLEPGFSRCMLQYFETVRTLSLELMKILALTLDIEYQKYFAPLCEDSLQAIRLLHYPPQAAEAGQDQLGTGAHTDFGAITCLLTDGVSGLQVLEDGQWIDVSPDTDAYIVNLGDIFSRLTAGVYKSSVHRVLNSTPHHRYSIPCFLDGNLDVVIESVINGPKPELGRMTVEEHMIERFETARGRVRNTGMVRPTNAVIA